MLVSCRSWLGLSCATMAGTAGVWIAFFVTMEKLCKNSTRPRLALAKLVTGALSASAFLHIGFIASTYQTYCSVFKERHRRTSALCPSSDPYPPMVMQAEREHAVCQRAVVHEHRIELSRHTCGFAPKFERTPLDMDHIQLSFDEFLWGQICVATPAFLLWVTGFVNLRCREMLASLGLVKPIPHDPSKVVANMVLESIGELVHFFELKADQKVATFAWHVFAMLDQGGALCKADILTVHIDLCERRMVSAKIDGVNITAKQAMILIWFHTISEGHVKIHALANWGVTHASNVNFEVYKNSVITVLYNYFGMTVFPRICKLLQGLRLVNQKFDNITDVFCNGLKQGVHEHGRQMRPVLYASRAGRFISELRPKFMREFKVHLQSEELLDSEALFSATVLHSLDHTFMSWNLLDPLWLDASDTQFGLMAHLGRFVRMGFVDDIPSVGLATRFKHSKTLFYRRVYEHAAAIDQEIADHMDTCIVK